MKPSCACSAGASCSGHKANHRVHSADVRASGKTHTASPPLDGSAAESSAIDSDPMVVSIPQSAHTQSDAPGDPTSAMTNPGEAKIPEPMTIPTTNVTALRSLRVRSMMRRLPADDHSGLVPDCLSDECCKPLQSLHTQHVHA